MMCKTKIPFLSGVAYGGNCSGNGDCVEANNVCTLTKCACSATSYKEDSNPTCATSKMFLFI